jgi:hypothetical protein
MEDELKFEPDEREILRGEFAALVARDPGTMVSLYLDAFGPVLSARLACELSNRYRKSDQARGHFRPAVIESARRIVHLAWLKLLSDGTLSNPVVIVTGGGPGSGKHTSITTPLPQLQKEFSIIFEASEEPPELVEALIREAHNSRLPVILAYVHRPVERAARASIIKSLKEGQPPDPEAFAAIHARSGANLLRLLRKYTGDKNGFALTVISNPGSVDNIEPTELKHLGGLVPTRAHISSVFQSIHNSIMAGTEPVNPPLRPQNLSPRKPPRRGKALSRQAAVAGYLLSESLRKWLVLGEVPETEEELSRLSQTARELATQKIHILLKPEPSHEEVAEAIPEPMPGDPPIPELLHQRAHGTNEANERATRLRERRITGQEELLDEERPVRIVVQERKGIDHNWETVLVR